MIPEETANESLYLLNNSQEEASARANGVSQEMSVFLASVSKLLACTKLPILCITFELGPQQSFSWFLDLYS